MRFTIPNLLSILRMGLVPLFIIAILDGRPARALAIIVLAGVTDGLDGFIARFWRQESLLGSYLDPMADKLLLISAYVVLAIPGTTPGGLIIPMWASVTVIARDVLMVILSVVFYLALGIKRFPPNWLGKTTTVVQIATAVVVILARMRPANTGLETAAHFAIYLTAGLTVASGLYYIYRLSRLPAGSTTTSPGSPIDE